MGEYKNSFREKYKDRVTYVNGNWVLHNKAVISCYDRGYTLGYNVYEYVRTFRRRSGS
jgi:branched-subunit amino acid aminotransferase/4-amino-4-deoxychorismate lyase